jgi:hypothetical protein
VSSVQDLIHEALEAAILGRIRLCLGRSPIMPCSLAHCLLNGVIMPASASYSLNFLDQAVRRAHLLYLLMDAPSRTLVLELWLPMWRVKQGPALAMYHSATRVVQCPPGEGAAGAQIAIPRFTVHLYLAEGANISGLKPFFTLQINLKGHHASP